MLEVLSWDDDDIDMGFGISWFEDEEDFDDSKVKFFIWGKDGDDGEVWDGKVKWKRGLKKCKGDVNNVDDVLWVME